MTGSLPSILITGTSSGMGKATTSHLAKNGFRVYAGVRTETDANSWKNTQNVTPVILDVTDQATINNVRDLISKDEEFFGLVNNAAIIKLNGILNVQKSDLLKVFDVNLFGIVEMIKTFYPLLEKNKGRIINISSINGFLPSARDGGYSMSKHAIEALTEQLRYEISPEVSVSVILPGLYKTEMVRGGLEVAKARYEAGEKWLKGTIDFWGNEENSRDPILIAETVLEILTSDKPKIRYIVAKEYLEKQLINYMVRRLLTASFSHPITDEQVKVSIDQVKEQLNQVE